MPIASHGHAPVLQERTFQPSVKAVFLFQGLFVTFLLCFCHRSALTYNA
jgi:hypothetical protein